MTWVKRFNRMAGTIYTATLLYYHSTNMSKYASEWEVKCTVSLSYGL